MQTKALASILSSSVGHPEQKLEGKHISQLWESIELHWGGLDEIAKDLKGRYDASVTEGNIYTGARILGMVIQVAKESTKYTHEQNTEVPLEDQWRYVLELVKSKMTPELFIELGMLCLSDEDRETAAERLLAIEVVPAELKF